MSNIDNKLILIILDGWGVGAPWAGNAIFLAKTPCFDNLNNHYPSTQLRASGEAVGLPPDERGNSEAGHLNLGAGKIVHQDVQHIFNLIKDGSFFKSSVLLRTFEYVRKNKSNLHLIGLISDGGIHSHIEHLFALLNLCKDQKIKNVYLHIFTDGRDTEPQAALSLLGKLNRKLKELKIGKIASVSGRYYAMDRDKHWERVKRAYNVVFGSDGIKANSAEQVITQAYKDGLTDEFVIPAIIKPGYPVKDGDGVIFFNVRGDRAFQLTQAIANPKFREFDRPKIKNLRVVTFTWYGDYIPNTEVAFSPEEVQSPLAKAISDHQLTQFHTAETEKYAHVTYFFNGGRKQPYPGEKRLLIPSPRVPTYDQKPEMSAKEVSNGVIKALKKQQHHFILVNFANPDMVGHTGNLKSAIVAITVVDRLLAEIIEGASKEDYTCLVTADHGNAEQMVNPKTGDIDTEHSCNPVPFIIKDEKLKKIQLNGRGVLADVAVTILEILKIEKPLQMSGKSLIKK